jgi:hypothetical protein
LRSSENETSVSTRKSREIFMSGKYEGAPCNSFGIAWQSGSCGRKLALGQIYGEVAQGYVYGEVAQG